MSTSLSYGSGDNTVLRYMIWRLWDQKCYWCGEPKSFPDIELDHIVPQLAGADLEEVRELVNLPPDFDIDDAANLAPSCGRCNRLKSGGTEPLRYPIVVLRLNKARDLRSELERRVRGFANSGQVAKALVLVSEVNLDDPTAQEAFETYAPPVVQRLALLDETKADYTAYRRRTVTLGTYEHLAQGAGLIEVGLSLNARGRTTLAILEELYRTTVAEALSEPLTELLADLELNTYYQNGASWPETRVESMSRDHLAVVVTSVDFEALGETVRFVFGGTVEGTYTADIIGDSGEQRRVTGVSYGEFDISVHWDTSRRRFEPHLSSSDFSFWRASTVTTAPR